MAKSTTCIKQKILEMFSIHFFDGLIRRKHLQIFTRLQHHHQLFYHLLNSHAGLLVVLQFNASALDVVVEFEQLLFVVDNGLFFFYLHQV